MKIRKTTAIVLSALFLLGLLAGCGAKASNDRAPMENYYVSTESAGAIYDGAKNDVEMEMSSSSDAQLTDRKLIKTVELTTETEALDQLLSAITARVSELGGYVENQRVYNGSSYASYRSRSATMTIRIPADRLDEFVDHVAEKTNIVSRYAYIDDVTLTYVATESRMEALQAEHDRLLELMDKAEKLSDLLEVEARLTDVRYELENITSQLNVLKNRVNYGTVHLNVEEVVEYTPMEEETFWQRVSGGFMDSLEDIGNGVVDLTVFILANAPYILLIAVGVVVVVVVAKRSIRKKIKKSENPQN